MNTKRRYDIDWLRVITIGLLLIYHIAIVFQPWGIFIAFIQSEESLTMLWVPMALLNVWRIPLLFFVSGMGVCFAIRKRGWKSLIIERSKRILLPFIFGAFCIVPIHYFIFQQYYNQPVTYGFSPGHLWFLGNIFSYVLLLSPIFFYLKNNQNGMVHRLSVNLLSNPLGLLVIMLSFVLEAILIDPLAYEMYAMTTHGFVLGLLAFFFGFCGVFSGVGFWQMLLKWKWFFLSLAFILFMVRLTQFQLKSPNYLIAIESNLWIFAVFAFGYQYLNRPSSLLSYLSEGAYPVYIVHMTFLYLGSYLILPLMMPVWLKFILIVVFTAVGCMLTYDLIIRRINLIRPLFGLKVRSSS